MTMSEVTYPHKSRCAKVDYLCSIGGYAQSHRGRWPIEFCVAAYNVDASFYSLWEGMLAHTPSASEHIDVITDANRELYSIAANRVYESCGDNLYDWAMDSARQSLFDDEFYQDEHGLSFELQGRQGKHLVLNSAGGFALCGIREDDLHDVLMEQTSFDTADSVTDKDILKNGFEWEVSTEALYKLYRSVRNAEVWFTPEKAAAQVQHEVEWTFYQRVADEYTDLLKEIAGQEELQEAAKRVLAALPAGNSTVDANFARLCLAAGIDSANLDK
jgi:hypothetical protein